MCVASIHLSYVLSIHLAMSIFRLGLMVKQRIGLCGRAWASCACGREEHARASGASGRSAHAAKKVGHGAASGGQVLSAALRSYLASSAAASLLRICLSLPPNSPKSGAASPAQGGGESQRLGLGSAGESRWAAGETPMALARKPGCHRLPSGRCPGPGFAPPLG